MARTSDIPALTGVRGVAALGVVAYHLWNDGSPPAGFAQAAIARGYIFVDLFFLLSGFVMASAYGRTFEGRFGAADYARFIAIRLARIYPVYAVVLAVKIAFVLVHPITPGETDAGPLLANVTLTQAWFDVRSSIRPAWSLSAEWAVYLVFPLFVSALLTSRPRTALAVCAAAGAGLVALWSCRVGAGWPPASALHLNEGFAAPMVRCFAGFAIGAGVFRLKDAARVRFAGSDAATAAVLLLTACLWLIPSLPDIVLYACLPALLLCLALNRGRGAALFGCAPMVALGEWSYSIYLIHILVLRGLERLHDLLAALLPPPLADAADAAVLFAVVIIVSAGLYRWIEVPARRRLRSYIGVRRLPAGLEPSAP